MSNKIRNNTNNSKTVSICILTPTTVAHGDPKIVVTNPATNRYKVVLNKRYKAVIGGRFQALTATNTPNSIGFDIKMVDYILNDNGKTSFTILVTNFDVSTQAFAFTTVAARIFCELKVIA